jgi:hypothetical protein
MAVSKVPLCAWLVVACVVVTGYILLRNDDNQLRVLTKDEASAVRVGAVAKWRCQAAPTGTCPATGGIHGGVPNDPCPTFNANNCTSHSCSKWSSPEMFLQCVYYVYDNNCDPNADQSPCGFLSTAPCKWVVGTGCVCPPTNGVNPPPWPPFNGPCPDQDCHPKL